MTFMTLLQLAEFSGAYLTGKPDGSEPITVVFSIKSWRAFDAFLREAKEVVERFKATDACIADSRLWFLSEVDGDDDAWSDDAWSDADDAYRKAAGCLRGHLEWRDRVRAAVRVLIATKPPATFDAFLRNKSSEPSPLDSITGGQRDTETLLAEHMKLVVALSNAAFLYGQGMQMESCKRTGEAKLAILASARKLLGMS